MLEKKLTEHSGVTVSLKLKDPLREGLGSVTEDLLPRHCLQEALEKFVQWRLSWTSHAFHLLKIGQVKL